MLYIEQGDCIERLKMVPSDSVDVIFIDPPYNTKNKKNKAITYDRNEDYQKKNWIPFFSDWDDISNYYEWCVLWLQESKRILKPRGSIFICGSFHNIPDVALSLRSLEMYTIQWLQWCIPNSFPNLSMTKMINANQTLIWCRKSQEITHYYDKEAAKRYNDGKNLRDYWLINNDTQAGKKWKHPSKKPVELVKRAIDISLPKVHGATVIDFFGGSGTSGIAVRELERQYNIEFHCTLIDNKEEYIAMMEERLYENKNT